MHYHILEAVVQLLSQPELVLICANCQTLLSVINYIH